MPLFFRKMPTRSREPYVYDVYAKVRPRQPTNWRAAETKTANSASNPLFPGGWLWAPTWKRKHRLLRAHSVAANHHQTEARWEHQACKPSCGSRPRHHLFGARVGREAQGQL